MIPGLWPKQGSVILICLWWPKLPRLLEEGSVIPDHPVETTRSKTTSHHYDYQHYLQNHLLYHGLAAMDVGTAPYHASLI